MVVWTNVCLKGVVVLGLSGLLAACDGKESRSGHGAENGLDAPGVKQELQQSPEDGRTQAEVEPGAASEAGGKGEAVAQEGRAAEGETSIWIQQARGNRQCEGGGKSLDQSGRQLAENGIKVQESRCGVRSDRMYPSVCGGATGDLLMHRIPSDFLDSALQQGFDPANPGTYNFSDCPSLPSSAPRDY